MSLIELRTGSRLPVGLSVLLQGERRKSALGATHFIVWLPKALNDARFVHVLFGLILFSRSHFPAVHFYKAKIGELDPEVQGLFCLFLLLYLKRLGFLY